MTNSLTHPARLSYGSRVLPIFRTTLVGGVLVILALLAGFSAPVPTPLARFLPPARGPLIDVAEHPEWKQFWLQAAYRRAGELERLRDLPDTPTIAPIAEPPSAELPPAASVNDAVASLPSTASENEPVDITDAIEQLPASIIPVDIGEASSAELPLRDQELRPPILKPTTIKRSHQGQRRLPRQPRAKAQAAPPAKPDSGTDLLTALFGKPADRTAAGPQR